MPRTEESDMAAQNAQKPGLALYAQAALVIILILGMLIGGAFYLSWFIHKVADIRERNKTLAAGQLETGVRAEPPDRITRLERRVEYESHRAHKRIDALYKHLWDEHMREWKKRLPPPPEEKQPQR